MLLELVLTGWVCCWNGPPFHRSWVLLSGAGCCSGGGSWRSAGTGRLPLDVDGRAAGTGSRAPGVGRRVPGAGCRSGGGGRSAAGTARCSLGVGSRGAGTGRRANGVGFRLPGSICRSGGGSWCSAARGGSSLDAGRRVPVLHRSTRTGRRAAGASSVPLEPVVVPAGRVGMLLESAAARWTRTAALSVRRPCRRAPAVVRGLSRAAGAARRPWTLTTALPGLAGAVPGPVVAPA